MKQGIAWTALVCALMCSGIPLFMILGIMTDIGITEISCDRIGPTQVDCIKTQSRYYGFVVSPSEFIPRVTEARFIRKETEDDCDCDDTKIDNSVALITDSGEIVTAAAEDAYRNNVKGDEKIMRAMSNRLNEFMKSDEISVSVTWDNRFTGFNLAFIGFTSIFLTVGFFLLFQETEA